MKKSSTHIPSHPPHGPLTLVQSELENILLANEAVEAFKESVMKFIKVEPGDTLDTTISKLEVLKNMLEPGIEHVEDSEFGKLIEMIKTTKESIEHFHEDTEYGDGDFVDNADIPRH